MTKPLRNEGVVHPRAVAYREEPPLGPYLVRGLLRVVLRELVYPLLRYKIMLDDVNNRVVRAPPYEEGGAR